MAAGYLQHLRADRAAWDPAPTALAALETAACRPSAAGAGLGWANQPVPQTDGRHQAGPGTPDRCQAPLVCPRPHRPGGQACRRRESRLPASGRTSGSGLAPPRGCSWSYSWLFRGLPTQKPQPAPSPSALPASDVTVTTKTTPLVRVRVRAQSCPTLCDPMGCDPPALEWVAISSSASFPPQDGTQVSCITGRFFTI